MRTISIYLTLACSFIFKCSVAGDAMDLERWYQYPEMQFYFLAQDESPPNHIVIELNDQTQLKLAKSRLAKLSPVFANFIEDCPDTNNVELAISSLAFYLVSYCHYMQERLKIGPPINDFFEHLKDNNLYKIVESINNYHAVAAIGALMELDIYATDEFENQLNMLQKALLGQGDRVLNSLDNSVKI